MAKSSPQPHLPASEVLRFGLQIVLRLAIATAIGLVGMKVGQWLWPAVADVAVITYGELGAAAVFIVSFLVRPVPFPELYMGPDDEVSGADT